MKSQKPEAAAGEPEVYLHAIGTRPTSLKSESREACKNGGCYTRAVSLCRGANAHIRWYVLITAAPKSACRRSSAASDCYSRRRRALFLIISRPRSSLSLNLQSRLSICAAEVRERICARRWKKIYSSESGAVSFQIPEAPSADLQRALLGPPRINSKWSLCAISGCTAAIPQRGALGDSSQLALISSDPDSPQPSCRVHASVRIGDGNRRHVLNDRWNLLKVAWIHSSAKAWRFNFRLWSKFYLHSHHFCNGNISKSAVFI